MGPADGYNVVSHSKLSKGQTPQRAAPLPHSSLILLAAQLRLAVGDVDVQLQDNAQG